MMKRFFCFDGDFHQFFDTADEARDSAKKALDAFRQFAGEDGEWPCDVETICWGEIKEAATEKKVEKFSDEVDYELRAL